MYRSHVRAVYAFLAYSVSRETAEDLTADTFERAIKAWDRFDPSVATEKTWLLAIARNALTDHYRRKKNRPTVSTDEHPALLDALVEQGDAFTTIASGQAVAELLGNVGPRDREVLALRYGVGLSARDTAAVTELTEANVNQITSRALRRLRPLVTQEMPTGRPEPSS